MKTCSTCKKEKCESNFSKHKSNKDGLQFRCKSCVAEHRAKNKDEINKKRMAHYYANKERINEELKKRYESDKSYREKMTQNARAYRQKFPEKKRKADYEYLKKKRETDPLYRLRDSIGANIRVRIKKGERRTFDILGCSIEEYKIYIENRFVEGMSWDNYGKWEIDHIKPISSFNLNEEKEIYKCFHYTNTQPLWAEENRRKSNKE